MASSLTSFRTALQTALSTALGITFESGMIVGPVEDRTVGCCWTAGVREWSPDVNIEEILLTVRVLKQWKQQQGLENPSLTDLEQLSEDLQDALKPLQTTLGPWQFRLTEVVIDLETSSIDGTISALQANRFAMGG